MIELGGELSEAVIHEGMRQGRCNVPIHAWAPLRSCSSPILTVTMSKSQLHKSYSSCSMLYAPALCHHTPLSRRGEACSPQWLLSTTVVQPPGSSASRLQHSPTPLDTPFLILLTRLRLSRFCVSAPTRRTAMRS